MLGKDEFKVCLQTDLSYERFKSLVLFYNPLIGNDALALYEFLLVKGTSTRFNKISQLLESLNMSIDTLESLLIVLNQYRLLKTLNEEKTNRYVFVIDNPLSMQEFIKDEILVRTFILKTSGRYYQSLLTNINPNDSYEGFIDKSVRLDSKALENWNLLDESFLNNQNDDNKYNYHTLFNVKEFLDECTSILLPVKFRKEENLKELARLGDLYNISFDKMRVYVADTVKNSKNGKFNLEHLRKKCSSSIQEYIKLDPSDYNCPNSLFLLNKQNGKDLTITDKEIIYNLAYEYKLNTPVINCLIEYALEKCDNSLFDKFIYKVASNLHRNNIETVEDAKNYLNKETNTKSKKSKLNIVYDDSNNPTVNEDTLNEIIKKRGIK